MQRYVEGDEHHSGGDEGSQQGRGRFAQVRGRRDGILFCCQGDQAQERKGWLTDSKVRVCGDLNKRHKHSQFDEGLAFEKSAFESLTLAN